MEVDVIGVDIGGTKIKAGIVGEDGVLKKEISVTTPDGCGGKAILQAVVEAVRHLLQASPSNIRAVGVGTAGRVERETGTIVFAGDTIPGWIGTEVKVDLERQLSLPVFVDNDVNCAALGDGWLGVARNCRHYAYVTIGTGLGGALVNEGEVIPGVRGGAGEFGHTILYPHGIPCGCGQRGCAEKYVSGTALNRLARQVNAEWDSYKLLDEFVAKNERAIEVVHQFVTHLSIVLINVQNMYDPEKIILGGGVIGSFGVWEDLLRQFLGENAQLKVNVFPTPLGNRAGVFGAARLATSMVQKGAKWNNRTDEGGVLVE